MTIKDTIRILNKYKDINNSINLNIKELKNIELEYYIKQTAEENINIKTNRISNITEKLALNIPKHIQEQRKYLEEQIKTQEEFKKEVYKKVNELDYTEKLIITEFYINKKRWQKISQEAHYSIRQCKNIRIIALKKLLDKFQTLPVIARFL